MILKNYELVQVIFVTKLPFKKEQGEINYVIMLMQVSPCYGKLKIQNQANPQYLIVILSLKISKNISGINVSQHKNKYASLQICKFY